MESLFGLANADLSFGSMWSQMLIGLVAVAAIFFRRGLLSLLGCGRRYRPDAEAGLGK